MREKIILWQRKGCIPLLKLADNLATSLLMCVKVNPRYSWGGQICLVMALLGSSVINLADVYQTNVTTLIIIHVLMMCLQSTLCACVCGPFNSCAVVPSLWPAYSSYESHL